MQNFTYKEQAGLVWQFICSIPVNLMEKFLPWLASSLSDEERQQMVTVMCEVDPPEELLQQVGLRMPFHASSRSQEVVTQTAQYPKYT
jgi:zinc finger-like protein